MDPGLYPCPQPVNPNRYGRCPETREILPRLRRVTDLVEDSLMTSDQSQASVQSGSDLAAPVQSRSAASDLTPNALSPADAVLDRYLPDAPPKKREEAQQNLLRFARLMIRVHERLARERPTQPIRGNPDDAVDSESLSSRP